MTNETIRNYTQKNEVKIHKWKKNCNLFHDISMFTIFVVIVQSHMVQDFWHVHKVFDSFYHDYTDTP
jgi:hypothetical protein